MRTDNYSLKQKVELRRQVCALLGQPLKVLDLFAGAGRVWWGMKEFCEIESYTPVDQKPRMSGVIKMTVSARTVRGFDLSQFNVIDVDCYGVGSENQTSGLSSPGNVCFSRLGWARYRLIYDGNVPPASV